MSLWISSPDIALGVREILLLLFLMPGKITSGPGLDSPGLWLGLILGLIMAVVIPHTEPCEEIRILPLLLLLALGGSLSAFF